jgi:2-polyprenyl-3-methyl-5-hydroxy-6-metoxy-1,4-benzoquinol methylase
MAPPRTGITGRIAFYDAWAPSFDDQQGALTLLEQPCVLGILRRIRGDRALDLGCGTGRYLPMLLSRFGSVEAIDFSGGMLQQARLKFADTPSSRLQYRRADIERIRLTSSRYDAILCAMVLGGIADKARLFRQCARALRPGGHAVFSTYHPMQALRHHRLTARVDGESRTRHVPFRDIWTVGEYVTAIRLGGLTLTEICEPAITPRFARTLPKHRHEIGWPHVLILHATKT